MVNCTQPYPTGKYFIIHLPIITTLICSEIEVYGDHIESYSPMEIGEEIDDIIGLGTVQTKYTPSLKAFDKNYNAYYSNPKMSSCYLFSKPQYSIYNWLIILFSDQYTIDKVDIVPVLGESAGFFFTNE